MQIQVATRKTTRAATALANGPVSQAAASLTRDLRTQLGQAQPAMVLAFASTSQPLAELLPALQQSFPKSVLLGASTAGEFTEKGDSKGGVAAFAVAGDVRVHAGLGRNLRGDPEGAVRTALAALPKEVPGHPHRVDLMLLDAMAGNGEEATLLALAQRPGGRIVGGAAGDDLQMRATWVGCGAEAAQDAVVTAAIFTPQPLGIGVEHGHRPLSEPLTVTRAEGNIVHEVNGKPAWEVWIRETEAYARAAGFDPARLAPEQIGPYLMRFEAGLLTSDGSYKIRAPLARRPDGSLQFACGIPTGTEFQITESSSRSQLASARAAARRARARFSGPVAGALVFDCICRNLILGREFAGAVRGMSEELGGAPLAGFETYGEIALEEGELSGFHNTTSVVLAFPK